MKNWHLTFDTIEAYACGETIREQFEDSSVLSVIVSWIFSLICILTTPLQVIISSVMSLWAVITAEPEVRGIISEMLFCRVLPLTFLTCLVDDLDILTYGTIKKLSDAAIPLNSELYDLLESIGVM